MRAGTTSSRAAHSGVGRRLAAAVALVLGIGAGCGMAQERFKAPPLEGGSAWLNSAGPIEISKLKGKVVLLDFWTYCCINCIHVLPDLARLERTFPNELVVIGVHSAKFLGEKDTQNIREAIMRYEIAHPVVNDDRMEIWDHYGVRSWPTRVVIDPEGYVYGSLSGEGHYDRFEEVIRHLIDEHRTKGTLDPQPLHFQLEAHGTAKTPLRFPGKVLADAKGGRLFVADSSQHRIIVAGLEDGKLRQVVGTGRPGHQDGPLADAQFNDPQGMAIEGDVLYVADRKNHRLRRIDLAAGSVSTIAGDGQRGSAAWVSAPGPQVSVASPWDLYLAGRVLYIAMAGTHQIWAMDLGSGATGPFAGTGNENITDGKRRASAFSQPSGLTSDGRWLYVADSEVSAVRKVGLAQDEVDTVVGLGLFKFGDVDGTGAAVRLQHALGVAWHNGLVYVADTYNNKIKTLDPRTRESRTFLGDGKPGTSDDPPRFDEPAGLSVAGDNLYVADTNNHRIRVIDLATRRVRTLELNGLAPPAEYHEDAPLPGERVRNSKPVALAPGAPIQLTASVEVPKDFKLNTVAPMRYEVERVSETGSATRLAAHRVQPAQPKFTIDLPNLDLDGAHSLRLRVIYYICQTGSEGVCRVLSQVWNVPVRADAGRTTNSIVLTP